MTMAKKLPLLAPSIHTFEVNGTYTDCEAKRTIFMAIQKMVSAGKYYRIPYHGSSKKGYSYKRKDGGLNITLADYPDFKKRYKGFERPKNDPCNAAQKLTRIIRMELIFNARQLSRCPELPAGHGNYACWQKSTASSSEQRRNSCLQDGKTLENLQARPDPVYEPMSVNHILRLGQS